MFVLYRENTEKRYIGIIYFKNKEENKNNVVCFSRPCWCKLIEYEGNRWQH